MSVRIVECYTGKGSFRVTSIGIALVKNAGSLVDLFLRQLKYYPKNINSCMRVGAFLSVNILELT